MSPVGLEGTRSRSRPWRRRPSRQIRRQQPSASLEGQVVRKPRMGRRCSGLFCVGEKGKITPKDFVALVAEEGGFGAVGAAVPAVELQDLHGDDVPCVGGTSRRSLSTIEVFRKRTREVHCSLQDAEDLESLTLDAKQDDMLLVGGGLAVRKSIVPELLSPGIREDRLELGPEPAEVAFLLFFAPPGQGVVPGRLQVGNGRVGQFQCHPCCRASWKNFSFESTDTVSSPASSCA